ncbi:hypothetical protein [Bradyrhizobium sp. 23AC]
MSGIVSMALHGDRASCPFNERCCLRENAIIVDIEAATATLQASRMSVARRGS